MYDSGQVDETIVPPRLVWGEWTKSLQFLELSHDPSIPSFYTTHWISFLLKLYMRFHLCTVATTKKANDLIFAIDL